MKKVINLPKIIGKGYGTYWKDKTHRYCVCKGSRGSKKSKTTAYWIIYNTMKYPLANTLVVRRMFNTLKDSCWTDLKWATYQLGVEDLWTFTKNPLQAIYKPTGQVILFRGLDNPMSITSITVENGYLCWCWFEEAYQIENEDAFNKVDMSIRGQLPDGYFKRIMVTFNPWNEHHWLKKRFFDTKSDNVLAMTTNYLCNEWLGEDDLKLFEEMKNNNPRRYNIEGLGNWGVSEGLVFDNWKVEDFKLEDLQDIKGKNVYGLDFGYNDPTTIISSYVDEKNKRIYIYDEFYKSFMSEDDIANVLKEKKLNRVKVVCDNARPEIIHGLKKKGCNTVACKKGKDSVLAGIQKLQDYEIIINPKCEHIIIEFGSYAWDKDRQTGKTLDKPIDDFNHCIDALRYSMEQIGKKSGIILGKK